MSVMFLVHRDPDNVGVAVHDLPAGARAVGRFKDQPGEVVVDVRDHVVLGHKLALRDIGAGAAVVEYGVVIGLATADIKAGQWVHTHNLRGQRWS